MAIIYTYPTTTTLENSDLFVISKMQQEGKPTRSISAANLANFIAPLIPVPGVSQIIAGTNVTISPVIGTGVVTINSNGSVSGTGTTGAIPVWTDGPSGVLGDSSITDEFGEVIFSNDTRFDNAVNFDGGLVSSFQNLEMVDGATISFVNPAGPTTDAELSSVPGSNKLNITVGTNTYNFGAGSFGSSEFDFKSATFNGGFYKAGNFRFEQKLAVGRANDPTGATLDVGNSTDTSPAAWFRNGVVISNNPSGVNVDNTSVVIGAGNNDIVSGSDNCLAVGNNNQILSNSDHAVAFGLGNTISNGAAASFAVGQGNTIDGTGIPGGTTVRSQVLGLNNSLTGSFASFIAGGNNTVTTEQNAMVLGFGNTTNGVDNVFAIGESNTLADATANGVFMIGNGITGQDGNMVLGFRNDTASYPATNYALGLGNTKLVLSVGTVNDSNAIIITEGGVTRGGGTAQEPRIVMPSIVNFNFTSDVDAANNGIPVGVIYHNAGEVRIRIV